MSDKPILRLLAEDPNSPVDLQALSSGDGTGKTGVDFTFTYLSLPLSCHCEGDGEKAVLSVFGPIGPIPYTAESLSARNAVLAIVEAANNDLGEIFSVIDGKIVMKREFTFFTKVNIANLVAALAGALVPLKPYIKTFGRYIVLPAEGKNAGKVRSMWRSARS